MIRLLCVVEVENATNVREAELELDKFREAVQPSNEYGITIYRAWSGDIRECELMTPEDGEV